MENNVKEKGLTKIWLTDARADETYECERGVSTQVTLAEVKGTQLHENAVIDVPAGGVEGDVGIYRVMHHENTL